MNDKREAVVKSALWAAYGDALGFMTELADEAKLRQRNVGPVVQSLVPWRRFLPGRVPISVEFRAGAYSDDTQLRLAVGRAIRADGTFDVSAFAKIELPTWANYALGAGVSSKEAAFSLAKASTQWHSNFFDTRRANYLNGGGNGAAMRVQPHVWASRPGDTFTKMLPDVIRDVVCTHGHPRGLVGAAFHALCLRFCLDEGRIFSASEMAQLAMSLESIWSILQEDRELSLFWVPQWVNGHPDANPESEFLVAVSELVADLEMLATVRLETQDAYAEGVRKIGAFEPRARGSAIKTSAIAAWLATNFASRGAHAAIVVAANCLQSDTDTIATMAGAILGVLDEARPPEEVQDIGYIVAESARLYDVSRGVAQASFGYPDIRVYQPPKSAVDAVVRYEDQLILSGLGPATPLSAALVTNEAAGDLQWLELKFGQTVLARVRPQPKTSEKGEGDLFAPLRRITVLGMRPTDHPTSAAGPRRVESSLDRNIDAAIRNGFDPSEIGRRILSMAEEGNGEYLERVIAYAVTVAKAYNSRKRRH